MSADTNIVLSNSNLTVTIDLSDIEEIIDKKLNEILPPQSSANWDNGVKDTKIVDLLRVRTSYLINGYISHGVAGDGDTSTDPDDKADNLRSIIKAGGIFNLTYKGETMTANATKLSLKKVFNKGINTVENEVGYSIILNVVIGVNI